MALMVFVIVILPLWRSLAAKDTGCDLYEQVR
jgi:hypothetical protein